MTVGKPCRRCGQTKPPEAFAIDPKERDGRSGVCKACMIDYANRRYRRRRAEVGATYTPLRREEEWAVIEAKGSQRCSRCGEEKPLDEFRFSGGPPRRRRKCKGCDRERMAELRVLRRAERAAYHKRYRCRQYGITPADYDRLLAVQEGQCAICGRPLGSRFQTIDHCHRTGLVRGIVHPQCNLVLGNAHEDVEILRGAIAYLLAHQRRLDAESLDTAGDPANSDLEEEVR